MNVVIVTMNYLCLIVHWDIDWSCAYIVVCGSFTFHIDYREKTKLIEQGE